MSLCEEGLWHTGNHRIAILRNHIEANPDPVKATLNTTAHMSRRPRSILHGFSHASVHDWRGGETKEGKPMYIVNFPGGVHSR